MNNKNSSFRSYEVMIGKIITVITGPKIGHSQNLIIGPKDGAKTSQLILESEDGFQFQFFHIETEQKERVIIESIVGCIEDLIESPLLKAESFVVDHQTMVFTFATKNGEVKITYKANHKYQDYVSNPLISFTYLGNNLPD